MVVRTSGYQTVRSYSLFPSLAWIFCEAVQIYTQIPFVYFAFSTWPGTCTFGI